MFSQRLLTLAANWDFRPGRDVPYPDLAALKLAVGQPHAEPAARHAIRFPLLQLMKVASALISWPLTVAWTLVNLPVMDRVHWSKGAAVNLPGRQGGLDVVG